ncbi:MAG: hypothetical protein IKU65_02095 [Oscillospiraceae bacterium]|nr:hypothetical protein [Oscillospiraceae bacterium]
MKFEGFYGNERAKEYISRAFARNSFPHALLITGERGIGKRTLANIVARALVCNGDSVPCGVCSSCQKALKGFHPDIILLGNDSSSVKVEEIRELKRDALILPNDSDKKVYILNNAGAMTHAAQDAFLKILEEPPAFTFFILLCSNSSDLLPTITSRVSHVALSPLSDSDMRLVIKSKEPGLSDSQIEEIIRTSDGVCSYLSTDTDDTFLNFASDIASAISSHDEFELFRSISALDGHDRDFLIKVFDELIIILRDSIVCSSAPEVRLLSTSCTDISKKLSTSLTALQCFELINYTTAAKDACLKNVGVSHITGNLICNFANIAASAQL